MSAAGPGLRLRMRRASLADLPPVPAVPRTLVLRPYQQGDAPRWEALVAACYPELAPDFPRFTTTFRAAAEGPAGPASPADAATLAARVGFLAVAGDEARVLGTATAWTGEGGLGRIHWVGVAPEVQGGGLARPLVLAALHRLAALGHAEAYLMTEDFRLPAIGLYRSLGFTPEPRDAGEAAAWAELLPLLGGPRAGG